MGASVSKVSISKVLHHNAAGFAASGSKKGEQPPMLSQSPIDIVENPTDELQTLSATETTLQLGAASAEMQLVHGGENFQVNWSDRDQNFLVLDGKKFYTAEDGALAVVGVFFREGQESAFLAQFWHEMATLQPDKHDHVALGKIAGGEELNALLEGKIFRYTGSLTTPPYSEGVQWVVVSDMLEASPEQLELFRNFLPTPNARDTQKLNGRKVSPCQCSSVTPIGA